MSTPVSATGRGAVVAGFDGSPHARQAVLWAAQEAANRRRELVVVSAIRGAYPELTVNPGAVALPDAMTDEGPRKHAERELAVVVAECARVAPEADVRPHVVYGHPTEVLTRVAQEAVLLVVGSSGSTGLTRALLGSSQRISCTPPPRRSWWHATRRSTRARSWSVWTARSSAHPRSTSASTSPPVTAATWSRCTP
ncbi:universal stress protein [Lentzea sp. PSKA42]|uniref:Universal stress protein n=1 Tax=Lentzea indica TaxID=2604800 RepID=A0ABX1FU99_9PSEU|nr:universal stress protein [Lentzea indica]NKE62404.1 universal stress protein [Lentzea indica]